MRYIVSLLVWVALATVLTSTPSVYADTVPVSPSLQETITTVQQLYSTDLVLGTPLEVDDLKIIPLATVGIGYGQRASSAEASGLRGSGGVLSPVGVLVVSPQGVQFFPIAKGVLEQFLAAIGPVVLGQLRTMQGREVTGGEMLRDITLADLLAALSLLLPTHGWRFGLFPWPLWLVVVFVVGWLTLALLLSVFFPSQMAATVTVLQEGYLRAGGMGVLGYGVVLLLAILCTLSIIGIPLTMILMVSAWAVHLFGTASIALLVGQHVATAFRRPRYPEGTLVLMGGGLLGLVRIVPVVGWVFWFILGIFGFGAVLRAVLRARRAATAT